MPSSPDLADVHFPLRVAIATVRALGVFLGVFLLAFAPFAFNGALASEQLVPPALAERLLVGFSMVVPGATLLIPIRLALLRPAWTNALFFAYCLSLALELLVSMRDGAPSPAQLWPAALIALNLVAYWQLRRQYNDV
jgi:hypothetical protein